MLQAASTTGDKWDFIENFPHIQGCFGLFPKTAVYGSAVQTKAALHRLQQPQN
jgi:hypothetical protein